MYIVPVERDHPTKHRSYVVYALLIANIVVGGLTLVAGPETVYRSYGFVPNDPGWVTLFTSMFLHGSFWHLLGNMFFLWMFGDNVEDVVGPGTFLAVYLLSGAAAGGAHLVMSSSSDLPLVGASGATSGILGVYLIFFPKVQTDLVFVVLRWEVMTLQMTAAAAGGVWFAQQVLFALVTAMTGLDEFVGIAFWAHVGGLLAGAALAVCLTRAGYIGRYKAGGPRNPLLGYLRSQPRSNDRRQHPCDPSV